MNNKASITALMSSFGRVFHAENEEHPVFADQLAKELMTPDDIQMDVIDKAGADMKVFEHVNYCLAVRKNQSLRR